MVGRPGRLRAPPASGRSDGHARRARRHRAQLGARAAEHAPAHAAARGADRAAAPPAPADTARGCARLHARRARAARRGRLPGAAVGLLHRHQQPRPGDDVRGPALPPAGRLEPVHEPATSQGSAPRRSAPKNGTRCSTTRCAPKATPPRSFAASNWNSSNDGAAVNRPILRLFGLVGLLFALLVAFTSRWTVFEASSLRENPLNKRMLLEQERIERGEITAADGAVLARSVRGRRRRLPAHLSRRVNCSPRRSASITWTPISAAPASSASATRS